MLLRIGRRAYVVSPAVPLRAGEITGLTGMQATTLLDLVRVVGEVTDDDREIVATVLHMLRSGRVRLSGSFRGVPFDAFD
jgi:hypothetical protein